MNQHEFVLGCQLYYAENYYEPGNPEDGEWHDCHYPVPGCLGGTETVKLLKEHHAIQGVLQSEEFDYPCIYGWESNFLGGEILGLYKKWMSRKADFIDHAKAVEVRLANSTPESRSESAKKGREKSLASTTFEERSEWSKKSRAKQLANQTPEQRKAIGAKIWESRRRNGTTSSKKERNQ